MAAREPRRVEVAVTELADEGLGVARLEETGAGPRTVMVRNALPGEALVAVVRKRRRGIWFAEALEHRVTAPERVAAPCSAYPRCAGCVLQHLDYDAQLAHKQALVLRLVAAQGIVPGRVRPPVSGPRFHYRHRARLGARIVDGRLLLGFREGFGNRIARITECRTLATSLAEALPSLTDALGSLSVADRIPQVELAAGDAQAAFVVRHLAPLSEADEAVLARFAAGGRRVVWVQPEGYDSVRPLGAGAVPRVLSYANPDFGLLYHFLPTDFTQVNPAINRALVRSAVLALDIQPGEAVVDLFSGIGNFSLALGRRGGRVFGFESGAGAVDRARLNADLNGLGSLAEFAVQDLYDASGPDIPAARLMLLDPPRSGAGPNLRRWISSAGLERIAYVSCNPATFATDAVVLQQQGFRLAELGVFDMFPQTAHIETLGLFIRSR
jgi:23S rRNA (uracil1939-C5)-methyltransferase